jgi:hypothetical protein
MTIFESNPEVNPTGEEAGEFIDTPSLSADRSAGNDPTRRPTGSPPLASSPDDRTSTVDGFEMLEQAHREIERQFQAFRPDDGSIVVRALCEQLTQYAALVQAAVIPVLRRYVDGGDDLADRLVSEQSAVATMVAALYDSATPERVPELVATLNGAMRAHIESVESEILPALQDSGVDPRQLGVDLDAAREGAPST